MWGLRLQAVHPSGRHPGWHPRELPLHRSPLRSPDCKQPDVPRQPIDSAVLNYFEQVALDAEGTVVQIADERDRRLAECDAKLAQARKVQAESERKVEYLDEQMRDAGLTVEEWRRLAAVPQRDAEAAALAIDDLTAERDQIDATLNTADAAGEFMERISALRAAVAGEVTSAESIARRSWRSAGLRRVHAAQQRGTRGTSPGQRRADGRGELRARAAGGRGSPAGHAARWNPGGYSLAAVAGAGQLTPVPPRPQ